MISPIGGPAGQEGSSRSIPMANAISAVLVHRDPHERAQLRAALAAIPGVQLAGERADVRAGLAFARQARPAILLLDLAPPVDDTLVAASQFRLEHPEVALFFWAVSYEPETLVRAIRAGAQEVLRRPLDRVALGQAVERVATLSARKNGGDRPRKIITVYSGKGGAGVTAIATNLAITLKRQSPLEVALVDLDFQSGDAAFALGHTPTRSLGDLVGAGALDSASLQGALLRHESGLFILSQPDQLERADGMAPDQVGTVLDILSSVFELVVVDAPHAITDVTLEIFDRSTVVLLLAEPTIPSVRAVRRSLDVFHRLNYLVAPDRVKLVVNRCADHSDLAVADVERALEMPAFAKIANDYAAMSRAINLGKPLCSTHTESRAGRDLAALGRALLPGVAKQPVGAGARERGAGLRLFARGGRS